VVLLVAVCLLVAWEKCKQKEPFPSFLRIF
jgi:hypothetical protein